MCCCADAGLVLLQPRVSRLGAGSPGSWNVVELGKRVASPHAICRRATHHVVDDVDYVQHIWQSLFEVGEHIVRLRFKKACHRAAWTFCEPVPYVGVFETVSVTVHPHQNIYEDRPDIFQIVAGHNRWAASRLYQSCLAPIHELEVVAFVGEDQNVGWLDIVVRGCPALAGAMNV